MAQSESANLYEYDAPSDVVDFEAPDHEDKVDHWFGELFCFVVKLAF